jgi:hypothetical protein
MKKIFLLFSLSLFSIGVFAQTNFKLNIQHKLGEEDFALEMSANNNLDQNFKTSRLEYYISEISISHDDGMKTTIDDLWILVDASEPTLVDLGEHSISSIDKINFHIGVNPEHNHEDPASYPSDHPLAPQFPSMHWGWAFGYRFIAFEGTSGNNFSQTFELHGLGDENYFKTEIDVNDVVASNATEFIINLNADYTRALENVQVSAGPIVHGTGYEAQTAIENFRDYVFSYADGVTSTIQFNEVSSFEVFPNPSRDGFISLSLNSLSKEPYQVSVTDLLGRQVLFIKNIREGDLQELFIQTPGFYTVNLMKDGQIGISKKILVQ